MMIPLFYIPSVLLSYTSWRTDSKSVPVTIRPPFKTIRLTPLKKRKPRRHQRRSSR